MRVAMQESIQLPEKHQKYGLYDNTLTATTTTGMISFLIGSSVFIKVAEEC